MVRRREASQPRPSAYDSLIDAERDALLQAGRKPTRGELIRALMGAAELSPRDARRAVDGFIDRRGGFIPSEASTGVPAGWVDDLLDAERARAARDDQSVTPRTLLRAVRLASPSLTPREARAAVADYLYRRGGRTLRPGRWRLFFLAILGLAALGVVANWLLQARPG